MRKRKIKILKAYKQVLLEYKKNQLSEQLSRETENKFPSDNKAKQKVLTLFKENLY